MDYKFRNKLKYKDIKIIESLVTQSGFFNKEEIAVAKELVVLSYKQGPKKSGYSFILVEQDKKVVAYSCFGKISYTKFCFDLYWIVVDKDHKNSGIGKSLLAETERVVKSESGKKLYAETSGTPLYEPTRKFYLNNNYLIVSDIKDFYDDGDNKVTFEKTL